MDSDALTCFDEIIDENLVDAGDIIDKFLREMFNNKRGLFKKRIKNKLYDDDDNGGNIDHYYDDEEEEFDLILDTYMILLKKKIKKYFIEGHRYRR